MLDQRLEQMNVNLMPIHQNANAVFKKFDQQNSGRVDMKYFSEAVHEMCKVWDVPNFTVQEMDAMKKKLDILYAPYFTPKDLDNAAKIVLFCLPASRLNYL